MDAPGIHVTAGGGEVGNIQVDAEELLRFRVVGPQGARLGGHRLRIEVDRVLVRSPRGIDTLPTVFVSLPSEGNWTEDLEASTDLDGELSIAVRFGPGAGAGGLTASISGTGLTVHVPYTTKPGGSAALLAPTDTFVYKGRSFPLELELVDKWWNLTGERGEGTALDPSIAAFGGGQVTGVNYGAARIAIRSAVGLDTVGVVVVPEGRIAVQRWARSSADSAGLIRMNLDRSEQRTHYAKIGVAGQYCGTGSDWAPDGKSMVAVDEFARILVFDLEGGSHALMPDSLGFLAELYPQFAPNGEWIYFSAWQSYGVEELWRIRPDGTGIERIDEHVTDVPKPQQASVSPDNQQIVFVSVDRSGNARLWLMDLASGEYRPLVDGAGKSPRWSPVDDRIAFLRDGDIYVTNGAGRTPTQLTHSSIPYGAWFDWSPDGTWIVAWLERKGYDTGNRIYLIEVASGLTLELPHTNNLRFPSWGPR